MLHLIIWKASILNSKRKIFNTSLPTGSGYRHLRFPEIPLGLSSISYQVHISSKNRWVTYFLYTISSHFSPDHLEGFNASIYAEFSTLFYRQILVTDTLVSQNYHLDCLQISNLSKTVVLILVNNFGSFRFNVSHFSPIFHLYYSPEVSYRRNK